MSDPYERVKGGRLTFKDGSLATRSKDIDKKKKKKKKKQQQQQQEEHNNPNSALDDAETAAADPGEETTYTIDAAKRMKYDQLFPVETKKFGYDPKAKTHTSVEDALDDRVKKKADRYCK